MECHSERGVSPRLAGEAVRADARPALTVGSRESRSPAGVVVASPDLIEDVLQTNADSYGKGEYLSGNLRDRMGDSIFPVGSPKWFHQRKTASNLFSMRGLRDSMAVMVQDSMPVLQRFFEKAETSGEPLDLFPLFNRFTLETFTEIVFGIKFGALNTGEEQPIETASNRAQEQLLARFLLPRWFWETERWLDIGAEGRLKKHINIISDTHQQHSAKTGGAQANGEAQKRDIISLFLDDVSYDGSTPDGEIDPAFLRDIVVNFLFAGRDTTAQALSWFFYCLSVNPHVEQQIRQEMRSKLLELANGAAATEQINTLVYLEAAIKESLRLHPSVAASVREALSPYQFNTFNAGPRVCLGVRLAMMEMKIVGPTS